MSHESGLLEHPSAYSAKEHTSTCSCGGKENCNCGSKKSETPFGNIYALGVINCRIPNLGVEKEIAQATGQNLESGITEEVIAKVISSSDYEYIARELIWTLSIEGIETFVIKPSDSWSVKTLHAALQKNKVINVLIGRVSGISEANGRNLPVIYPVQIYTFDAQSLSKSIAKPKEIDDKTFRSIVSQILNIALKISGNIGLSDAHRAMNYLVTRYAELYDMVARQEAEGATVKSIQTRVSPSMTGRRTVEVVLMFQHTKTGVQNHFVTRVDVTDLFPHLVSPLSSHILFN